MFEVREEEERKTRAFLVGQPGNDLRELTGLAKTAGMEIAGKITLTRLEVQPAYGMGKGKAQEIYELAKENQADCIIFDFDMEPTKQRNWEKMSKLPCFDRQELIIRIFAQRARTKEAVLQVELARLTYSLPRLAHSYGELSRQRGGSYGSKGSGETQLELDQRQVRSKIIQVKKELAEVTKNRNTQKKKRNQVPVPECALVGYTNAGKSSLLNALTGEKTFVEDELFATLDPLTRRLKLKDGNGILLTDTVGFIKNLPHSLIDAFKSTLAAASDADLLLIVLDASDSQVEEEYKTVIQVLEETKADLTKSLIVLNKWDYFDQNDNQTKLIRQGQLLLKFPEGIKVSAKNQTGFEELFLKISQKLFGYKEKYQIPLENADLVQQIRKKGIILKEEWQEDSVLLEARLNGSEKERFSKYLV
ncbi:MAG: GTPase HflX [Treponema sp.]|nr:GTPase HflX [Treponema sp.]